MLTVEDIVELIAQATLKGNSNQVKELNLLLLEKVKRRDSEREELLKYYTLIAKTSPMREEHKAIDSLRNKLGLTTGWIFVDFLNNFTFHVSFAKRRQE